MDPPHVARGRPDTKPTNANKKGGEDAGEQRLSAIPLPCASLNTPWPKRQAQQILPPSHGAQVFCALADPHPILYMDEMLHHPLCVLFPALKVNVGV